MNNKEQATMIKVGEEYLSKLEAISLYESSMMTINNTLPYLRAMVLDSNTNNVERVDLLELIEHHNQELGRYEALVKEAKAK